MEIRGIGIIDVSTLYGTGAIMPSDQISLIVHLETWTPDVQFDVLIDRGDTPNQFKALLCLKFLSRLKLVVI